MRRNLVIGLGSPVAGDDAVGLHVARALAGDPPRDTDVIVGGTDLLRLAGLMEGRDRVVLVDAVLARGREDGPPGRVEVFEWPFPGLDDGDGHAHHLSTVQAVKVLKATRPDAFGGTRFTLVTVVVSTVASGENLSSELEPQVDGIVRHVRCALTRPATRAAI